MGYMMSLTWSLAQFTVATTTVQPGSFAECAYSVGITLLASFMLLMLFSDVVYAALQAVSTANGKRQQQLSLLMEYLVQGHVPPDLRSRVWATANERAAKRTTRGSRVHEEEVAILACLPQILKSELRTAVYAPTLKQHPLFDVLSVTTTTSVLATLSDLALRSDCVLFSTGDVAVSMYFVAAGELRYRLASEYHKAGGHRSANSLGSESTGEVAGPWFCEPALWIHWKHRGEMTAAVHSELYALNCKRFQVLMLQAPQSAGLCRCYAKLFANYVKQHTPDMTDVYIGYEALRGLVALSLDDA